MPATPAVDRRAARHVDDHGDHEADELEELKYLAGKHLAGTDLARREWRKGGRGEAGLAMDGPIDGLMDGAMDGRSRRRWTGAGGGGGEEMEGEQD